MKNENKESTDSRKNGNRDYYGRIYPGITLIIVGSIFLLNNFGYLQGEAWGKLWPLFIIIPGLFMVFRSRR